MKTIIHSAAPTLLNASSTITLTQLAYAVAVDMHRRFASAAEACHVTQPTLSMQLQKLDCFDAFHALFVVCSLQKSAKGYCGSPVYPRNLSNSG